MGQGLETLSILEQLMHSTFRIECRLKDGGVSTGTGFGFAFAAADGSVVPAMVSNKHVVDGASEGTIAYTMRASDADMPVFGQFATVTFENFEDLWHEHPDPAIDLAIMPIAPVVMHAEKAGKPFYFKCFDEQIVASQQACNELAGLEDVIMIGYPNGIWDSTNNLPIVRRGIAATLPRVDFRGEPKFLVDCAVFPGSSGSPVLLIDRGGTSRRDGSVSFGGTRVVLLGIVSAVFLHQVDGEVIFLEVPVQTVPATRTQIPNNLGVVIKAAKLLDFGPVIQRLLQS